jgi:hypothetical protein
VQGAMNTDIIHQIISDFAETHHFVQQVDIEFIENVNFDEKNYNKIHGKPFILLAEYSERIEIEFGKIVITVDNYDEEELYSIETDILFSIDVANYSIIESLIEDIVKKCKHHKLI